MSTEEIINKKCHWVHINNVDETVGDYLKDNFKFHALDLEDVLSGSQRPKLDIYKYYLFIISVFPYYDNERNKIRWREVDIFLTEHTLITIAKKPNPYLDLIFKKISESEKIKKAWFKKGPSYLLYKILERLYRDSHRSLDVIAEQISSVEEDVYENELKSVAHDLARIRRSVYSLRRLMEPQKHNAFAMVNLKRDYIANDMNIYFDNIHDYLEKSWVEIESYRDTIDGLHRTNESLISQHTNRIITILTVISASLMPLSLLSGMYGMNLVTLPYADHPTVVFSIFGVVTIIVVIIIYLIFRKKRTIN